MALLQFLLQLTFLPWLGLVCAGTVAPALLVAGKVRRWRGKRLNQAGRCGRCRDRLGGERFLLHGVELCETCTERARSRLSRGLWATAAVILLTPVVSVTGLATAGLTGTLLWWDPVLLFPLLAPPLAVTAGSAIQLRRMKRANRRTLLAGASEVELLPAE